MDETELLKKKILFRNLVFTFLLFFLIFIVLLSVILNYNYKKFIYENLDFCSDISNIIEKSIDKDFSNLPEFSSLNSRVTLIDCNGKVLYDNKADISIMEAHFDRIELLQSMQKGSSYEIRTSKTLGKKLFYYSKIVTKDAKCIGFIRISKEITQLEKTNLISTIILLSFLFLLFFITMLLSFNQNSYLFSIINLALLSIQNITEGKENNNIFLKQKSWIYGKQLQNKIENLLLISFSKTKEKIVKNEIEIISNLFENFDEPVLLFSENGQALVANGIARKIFIPDKFQTQYKEKYFWEIFISSEISSTVQKTMEYKDKTLVEIEFGDRLFLLRVAFLNSINSIFLIFTDISEAKRYYELIKGILSAITHELKTPLTSLNGFLEQIIIEAEEKKLSSILSYAQIAERNCHRLILLTEDIIELEKMHYQKKLNIEKFEINSTINEIMLLFYATAKEKNIELSYKTLDKEIIFSTDKNLFEQILINLVDNAIKYTDHGFVIISAEKTNDKLILSVEDSGIGIEEKEIPKIFEPFYCVDKSRSKQRGGTGLGLSIVKKATIILGGSIDVISHPYKGSKFVVVLPYLS